MPATDPREPVFGTTKTEQRSFVRDMRARDREQSAQAKAALRAEGIDPETMLPLDSPRSGSGSSSRPVTVKVRQLASSSPASTAAGIGLGAFAYFLGLAFIRGGPQGAKAWLAAKFANRIWNGSSYASAVPASASTSSSSPAKTSSTTSSPTIVVVPATQGQPSVQLT